jgi:iron complex outermembrane recepter protein
VDAKTITDNDVTFSAASTELAQMFGAWVVEKDLKAFNNDFSFSKKWDGFKITAGVYTSEWSVSEWWSIGNQKWYQLKHNGEQIKASSIVDDPSTVDVNEATCQATGNSCAWKYDVDANGDAREIAEYIAGEIYIAEDVTVDVGVRNANRKTTYAADTGARDGIFETNADADVSKRSYTAAVNWNYGEDQGVFLRMNSGFKFADFDDYRNFNSQYKAGSDLVIDVDQQELGYKLSTSDYSLFATLFHNTTKGAPDCNVGSPVCNRFETHSTGIELDGNIRFGDFSLNLNGTIQDPVIDSDANEGNQVLRQPKSQFRLTPSYNLGLGTAEVSLYGTVSRISDRYGDNANTNKLPGYTKLDLGTLVTIDKLSFQLAVDNLTDEEALTESDPRAAGLSANGRYIMPRNIKLTIGYNF